jgi:hypothetical protein
MEFVDALGAQVIRARLASLVAEPEPMKAEAFAGFVKAELAKYEGIVKATGAKVE